MYKINRGDESGSDKGYYTDNKGFGSLGGDLLFDITNMVCGYSYERFYSFIPYAGLGVTHKTGSTDLSTGMGIINRFRINDRIGINLDLSSSYVFANG